MKGKTICRLCKKEHSSRQGNPCNGCMIAQKEKRIIKTEAQSDVPLKKEEIING